ncbi:MAG TPA: glycoside hydrolase family 2 TIM barrel-domain containing protein [Calditrichia bacterium]|nr:glycoside hydrolase family 2 TIM barrel-domain containing protein [Calditrichia bacterium]
MGWQFAPGDSPAAKSPDFDDSNWRTLDLPHDWSIEGTVNPANPSGNDGGYFPTGVGWYRKTFAVPETWNGQKISLYFEGVYMNAEVFVNGESLGTHPYGYTAFICDLTPHLKPGKKNLIAVRVDNSRQKNCRWYSGSGIYRHVWLVVTGPLHFDHWGVGISTPEVSRESATVRISATLKNETGGPQQVVLATTLKDPGSQPRGHLESEIELPAGGQKTVVQEIQVKAPLLWDTQSPHLYTATSQIRRKGEVLDRVRNTFGIRRLDFSAENGFQLNGQKVVLNGGCVHHDNGCLGAAAYDRAEARKVELLKAAGFNAVRTSHNPPSEAFLDACDRLGMLVIDESFDGWRASKTPHDYGTVFDAWWQRDIEAMVLRDRNHPSIILWSSGNEILERTEPRAIQTARMLNNHIRKLDPTRPVTSAMTTWGDQGWARFDSLFAEHDVAGYNYQLHFAESDHHRVPERIIVQTESYPRDAFANWQLVQENDFVIGDFVWTAMDYLGESGIGRYYYPGEPDGQHWELDLYPWHGAYCGDIDLTGWRKPISHYRSMLYNDAEKLFLAVREPNPENGEIKETIWSVWPTWESWTWPGYEGKKLTVEVYSRYPKVQLYLNGKLAGEQPVSVQTEFKAIFEIPYAPGELKAVGMDGDNAVEFAVLKTAGAPAAIKLGADRPELVASGQDLSYVTVEINDEQGIRVPSAQNRLTFRVDGPGTIAGVDNANLKDDDPYVANSRKVWQGRALVVIKNTGKAGDINLTVRSDGLPDARLVIRSR